MKYLGKVASTCRKVILTPSESCFCKLQGLSFAPMKMPVMAVRRQNLAWLMISRIVSCTVKEPGLNSQYSRSSQAKSDDSGRRMDEDRSLQGQI